MHQRVIERFDRDLVILDEMKRGVDLADRLGHKLSADAKKGQREENNQNCVLGRHWDSRETKISL
jgi:hypothetical protein